MIPDRNNVIRRRAARVYPAKRVLSAATGAGRLVTAQQQPGTALFSRLVIEAPSELGS